MSSTAVNIPQRRSLAAFAFLALGMILSSYLFTFLLAAACVYLPWLAITAAPNFHTLMLFLGGIAVAGVLLWSLVPRRDKFVAPGPVLQPASHPRLFAEIEQIAKSLNEPLPREVYLMGEANAWVADRGGFMGLGSRRVMALGLPLLAALNISQFRAILAHEFAHYYGGDTSLGPWIRRCQMGMIRTFQTIGAMGEARLPAAMAILYMIVFGILKGYWLLFLRAINFVSRRQEYRADELACILGGPRALASGLRMIHGTNCAWPAYWNGELAPMLNMGSRPPIALGFSQFLSVPIIATQVEAAIGSEIEEGKVQPYDSHPPLRDRLRAVQSLSGESQPDDPSPALSLLNDPAAEELRFLQAANPTLQADKLKPVSWEEQAMKVLVPNWVQMVTEYASLLQGITAEKLPEALGKVREMGPKIRDPKGMLLTPEQREQRARSLLSSAFALALVNHGWTLHSGPGEFYLNRGEEKLNTYDLIRQLSKGAITKEAWAEKCRGLGIENVPLAIPPQDAQAAKTGTA